MTKKAPKEVKRDLTDMLPVPVGNEEKKSAIMGRFAESLLFADDEFSDIQAILYIAILAWNLSFLSPHRCAKALVTFLNKFPLAEQIESSKVISALIELKKKDFAEHDWMVYDVKLEQSKNRKPLLTIGYVMLGEGDERRAILSAIDGADKDKGRNIVENILIERSNAAKQQQNPI